MSERDDRGPHSDADAPALEAGPAFGGPTFHVDERVLCTDARRAAGRLVAAREPLFPAVVRRSDVKRVDPKSGEISGLQEPLGGDGVARRQWCHLVQ